MVEKETYSTQRKDCTGKVGVPAHQKATVLLRIHAYEVYADAVDEVLAISESTVTESADIICRGLVQGYKDLYRRKPTAHGCKEILQRTQQLGFPGILGSIDCCKWK